MDILIIYSFIITGVFFLISIALGVYIYFMQQQMHAERESLIAERERLGDEVLNILRDAAEERKDLYDRLQAGTLPQYKEHTDAPNEVETAEDEEIVDLESAKDEIMNSDG